MVHILHVLLLMTAKESTKPERKILLNTKTDSENNLLSMGSDPVCESNNSNFCGLFRVLAGRLCVPEWNCSVFPQHNSHFLPPYFKPLKYLEYASVLPDLWQGTLNFKFSFCHDL